MKLAIALPLLAVLAHLLGLALLREAWMDAFGLGAGAADPSRTYAVLVGAGILGATASGAAVYVLLRRARLQFALPAIVLVCLPALLLSWVYLYSFAMFRGWA